MNNIETLCLGVSVVFHFNAPYLENARGFSPPYEGGE
jgi:hypothetical protein